MLDNIILEQSGGTPGYSRTTGEPWLSNPPWAKLIVWAPANAIPDRPSNYLQSNKPIRVWWYTDNQLTETKDKQKSISEYRQRYMKGLSAVNRYYEFGIVSIAEDRQSAKVYVGVKGGGGVGYGSYYTLQRSPSGKWWIVKTEKLWIS